MGFISRLSANFRKPKMRQSFLTLAFVLLAIVGWSVSSLLPSTTIRTIGKGQLGPVSAASDKPISVPAPIILGQQRLRSIDIQFRFRVEKFKTHENLFQTGPTNFGLRMEISPDGKGNYTAVLITQLSNGSLFVPPLVDNIILGKTYSVVIKLDKSSRITAWVDNKLQFAYSYSSPILKPTLSKIVVGTGFNQLRPFDGVVSDFKMTFREFSSSTMESTVVTLQVAAALFMATAIVIFLLQISIGEFLLQLLGVSGRRLRTRWRANVFTGRVVFLGLLLVIAGTAVLELVTPPENAVLQKSGEQIFRSTGVSLGQVTSNSLAGAPQLFNNAAATDVSISFNMKLGSSTPRARHFSSTVVSTFSGNQGLLFEVRPSGKLICVIGQVGQYPGPLVLAKQLPRNRWISVQGQIDHGESVQFQVDGQKVFAFSSGNPYFNATPLGLQIGGDSNRAFNGSISKLKMTVVLYQEPSTRIKYLLVRLSQLLAILAIALGIFVLARRFLSRLFPATISINRALVFMVFGTTGIGIAINFLVDQLHIQQSPIPYIQRNTWLYSPTPRFSDFLQVLDLFKSFHPYGVLGGNYPPVGYWMLVPFAWISNEYVALFVFIAFCLGFLVWWFARSFATGLNRIEKLLIVSVAFLSLPTSFAFDRANLDLLVFIMVVVAIASYEQKRGALAASWLGLASAAKLFPGLYLLVFIRGRMWRFIALGTAVAILCTVFAVTGFHGSLDENIRGFLSGLFSKSFDGTVITTWDNASLVGALQGLGLAIGGISGIEAVWRVIGALTSYVEIGGILLLVWYLRWREQVIWRAVTLITIAFLILPVVSYYYELMYLFIPVALFIRSAEVNVRTLRIACLFGLVLAPKAYFYLASTQVDSSVLLTAPLLIALAVAVVHDGLIERRAVALGNNSITI